MPGPSPWRRSAEVGGVAAGGEGLLSSSQISANFSVDVALFSIWSEADACGRTGGVGSRRFSGVLTSGSYSSAGERV